MLAASAGEVAVAATLTMLDSDCALTLRLALTASSVSPWPSRAAVFGDMAAKTAALLGQGLTEEAVSASLSVSAQSESNIVNVAATATSPALAANIANTYTNQFVSEQQN